MRKYIIIIVIAISLIAAVAIAGEKKAFSPSTNGDYDLGQSGRAWKDGYFSGDIYSNGTLIINSGGLQTVTRTVTSTSGGTGADTTVPEGAILLDTQPVSGFSNDVTTTKSIVVGTTWIYNCDAHSGTLIVNGVFDR